MLWDGQLSLLHSKGTYFSVHQNKQCAQGSLIMNKAVGAKS
jgi:hypothetical protein